MNELQAILKHKFDVSTKNKVSYTFRCSPWVWEKLKAIHARQPLKLNDTLEAIIEFAYKHL